MEEVIAELERMVLELYTPMTKEEWERNEKIYERVFESVGIGVKKEELIHKSM